MIFERVFLINGTDMVAATNIFDAKDWWMKNNPVMIEPKIEPLDLDLNGLNVEVESEMEAVQLLQSMLPDTETHFTKTKDCRLLVYVTLKEAIRCREAEEPYLLAKVGM